MKKKLSLLACFICLFSFMSCSSNELTTEEICHASNSRLELQEKLSNFNDSIISNKNETKTEYTTILSTVAADVIGAYRGGKFGLRIGSLLGNPLAGAAVGGLLVGAAASYLAYENTNNTANYQNTENLYNTFVGGYAKTINEFGRDTISQDLIIPREYRNISLYVSSKHNQILSIIESTDSIDIESFNTVFNVNEQLIINNPQFKLNFNNSIYSTTSYAEDDSISIEMKQFINVLLQYCQTLDDVVFVINNYTKLIEIYGDALSEEEKYNIYCGFAVAENSYRHWHNSL